MMRKRGFTLVELLAVIVILAIILAIAVPGISSVIKSSTASAFESDAKMVLKSVDYKKMEDESFDISQVNKSTISSLLGISDANYSSVSITLFNGNIAVSIVGAGKWVGLKACGTFHDITVVDATQICSFDHIAPTITLLGNANITINIGDSYTDAGVTATDNIDGDITSNVTSSTVVNPNASGTYVVTYNVSDAAGNAAAPVIRTVNVIGLTSIDVLIVAGGGGGGGSAYNGWYAGSGGGGGVIYKTDYSVTPSTYTVTVGAGGSKGISSIYSEGTTTTQGGNGGNSSFGSLVAIGGGGGGAASGISGGVGPKNLGREGGSGGGAGVSYNGTYTAGGTGTPGQGYNGGNSGNGGSSGCGSGGGSNGVGSSNVYVANGGPGITNSITGSSLVYAKGGSTGVTNPSNAADNTGNGGDASVNPTVTTASANGGSGVVIIRYAGTQKADGGTVTSVGGYTIHKFTSGSATFIVR